MKIQTMRRFTKKTRLQSDSVPEITEPFEDVVVALSRTIRFDGGKLRPGHVLNALIHSFNGMPAKQRTQMAALAVARLETLLAETDEEREAASQRTKECRSDFAALPYDPETGEPLGPAAKKARKA